MTSCLLTGILPAKDWPNFRGPHGDNSVPEAKIARSFPETGPKVNWSIDVEAGYGGVAIAGDEVFFMDRVDQERDVLRCVGLADGKEKWKWEHEVPGRISHPGSRVVPTVVADAIYTSSGFGHVYCIDRKTHKKRWIVDVAKTFGAHPPKFGYSVHPVLHGDTCIIAPSGDEVGLAALDQKTGKVVWKTGQIGDSHSSPVIVKILDRSILVMPGSLDGNLVVSGFNPDNGKELFRYSEKLKGNRHNAIPNVAVIDRDTVFLTGGYGQGTKVLDFAEADGMIKVTQSADIPGGSTLHPVLKVGEQNYMTVKGGRGGRFRRRSRESQEAPPAEAASKSPAMAGLVCTDPTGKVLWSTGTEPGFGEGSLILAGGTIISQDGDDGTLRLIQPGPSYKELAKGKVFSKEAGEELWAPLALAGDKLMMRSQSQVVCVDLAP